MKIVSIFILLVLSAYSLGKDLKRHNFKHEKKASKLVQTSSSEFKLYLNEKDENPANFRCSYGGVPLVIWSVPYGETVKSGEPIEPSYVADGYVATDIMVNDKIISSIEDEKYLHVRTTNPGNGEVMMALSRRDEKPFYVATSNFPPVYSDFSKQTVFNYQINLLNPDDTTELLTRATPDKNHTWISSAGVFVYDEVKVIEYNHYAWDQLLKWTNAQERYEQDLIYLITPKRYEDGDQGHGFYVCGFDEEPKSTDDVNLRGTVFFDREPDSISNSSNNSNLEFLK